MGAGDCNNVKTMSGKAASDLDTPKKGPSSPLKVNIPSPQTFESPTGSVPPLHQSPSATETSTEPNKQTLRLTASDVHREFVPVSANDGPSSWSASSDRQLATPGSTASDRVYPIRSVVSVDSAQTPYTMPGRKTSEHQEYFPPGATGPRPRNAQGQSFAEADRSRRDSRIYNQSHYRKGSTSTAYSDSDTFSGSRLQIFSDATSDKSNGGTASTGGQETGRSTSIGNASETESISGLMTARFTHIVTAEGKLI